MSRKLFCGGLAWATSSEGLRTAFEPFGEVTDAKVVTDRETGRSRGFGFVTFSTEAQAETAQGQMDGQQLDGRSIRVDIAREREGGEGGGGGPRGAGGPGGGRRSGGGFDRGGYEGGGRGGYDNRGGGRGGNESRGGGRGDGGRGDGRGGRGAGGDDRGGRGGDRY